MRGINRQTIFEDEQDYKKFIGTLEKYKEICKYELYAYCLMGNHIHILLKEGLEPLEQVMRRICGSYVFWYNQKYDRIGNLFQDRYASEPVENNAYFLAALRYIFQNPVKAGIVNSAKDYKWHNYLDYVSDYGSINLDTAFVLGMFHSNKDSAKGKFTEFVDMPNEDNFLDMKEDHRLTDSEAEAVIRSVCKLDHAIDLQKFEKKQRDELLRELKKYPISIRQMERLTGINRGVILKAK
jgi:REP element-mobilizing transposase RayT